MTKDVDLKFGIDKCGVLAMKKGKGVECNGIELKNDEEIGQIGEEGCKHLGVLEKRDMCQKEIKENIRKEWFKRLRATLKSKLNAKHGFQVINTWMVSTVRLVLELLNEQRECEGNGSKNKKDYHHIWWATSEIKR